MNEANFAAMFEGKSMNPETSKTLKSMAKTEKEKESVQPTVINDTLIKQYLIQYNRENKIFGHDESLMGTMGRGSALIII